ncbi:unnamed protein product [Trifolium pratense]|uniref:Uncharacterized protein n=1 Tax=Trifolium pratense TaxID=57577 RepID=A0ACB0KUN5_TRIPR|nr:unnamed protein product [Trifolium pratense]
MDRRTNDNPNSVKLLNKVACRQILKFIFAIVKITLCSLSVPIFCSTDSPIQYLNSEDYDIKKFAMHTIRLACQMFLDDCMTSCAHYTHV